MTKDDQLKASIEEALSNNMRNTSWGINVQVEKGFVKIHGMVDTLAERQYAEKLVQNLPQVKGIDNGLTVAMDNFRNDDEITHMVREKFLNEPRIHMKRIGAQCDKGVVVLRGQSSSLGEVELAKELAAEVPGVREVRTLIKLKEEAKDVDASSIVNGVEVAFATSGLVEAEDILTSCKNGVVTLEGTVDNDEQKEAAVIIAQTVTGVRRVINNLATRHDNLEGDNYLTNKLRKELNRDKRVSPAQIKAFVNQNTAYLSGQVYSIDAKKGAEEVARELESIDHVINDIEVKLH